MDLSSPAFALVPAFNVRFGCVASALAASSLRGLTTYEVKSAGQTKSLAVRALLARENLAAAPRAVSCHRRLSADLAQPALARRRTYHKAQLPGQNVVPTGGKGSAAAPWAL